MWVVESGEELVAMGMPMPNAQKDSHSTGEQRRAGGDKEMVKSNILSAKFPSFSRQHISFLKFLYNLKGLVS